MIQVYVANTETVRLGFVQQNGSTRYFEFDLARLSALWDKPDCGMAKRFTDAVAQTWKEVLAAAAEKAVWQPIETAPPGKRVVIYTKNPKKPFDVAFAPMVREPGKPCTETETGYLVTHWMPLPEPPK